MTNYIYWMVHSPAKAPLPMMYCDKREAVLEARRLAALIPGIEYFVLEASECYVVKQPDPVSVPLVVKPPREVPTDVRKHSAPRKRKGDAK